MHAGTPNFLERFKYNRTDYIVMDDDWVSAVLLGLFILFFLPFILIFGGILLIGLIGILTESLLRLGVPAPLSLILAFSAVGAAGFFILGKLFKGWSSSSSDTSWRSERLGRDDYPQGRDEWAYIRFMEEMEEKNWEAYMRRLYGDERYQDS
jgi:hypothetical protein